MTAMAFTGWPPEAFALYRNLEADNTRTWWLANKATYDAAVRGPMVALGEAVADEFGPMHVFRPNRDVRFTKDKSPYKTSCYAVTENEGGTGYFVRVSAEGLTVAAGYYVMAPTSSTVFAGPSTTPDRAMPSRRWWRA